MATAVYGKGLQHFGDGGVNWTSDDVRLILADSADYTVSINSDEFISTITGGAGVVGQSAASLANKTNTLGVLDADDHTISSVSGDQFEAVIVYRHTGGSDGARMLLFYIDNYTGLPCTPNGGNITVAFPNDSNKIAKL